MYVTLSGMLGFVYTERKRTRSNVYMEAVSLSISVNGVLSDNADETASIIIHYNTRISVLAVQYNNSITCYNIEQYFAQRLYPSIWRQYNKHKLAKVEIL